MVSVGFIEGFLGCIVFESHIHFLPCHTIENVVKCELCSVCRILFLVNVGLLILTIFFRTFSEG